MFKQHFLTIFTQGCHKLNLLNLCPFIHHLQVSHHCSLHLQDNVYTLMNCDNPGSGCGSSPTASVIIITALFRSAQVNLTNTQSQKQFYSLTCVLSLLPSAPMSIHYSTSIKHCFYSTLQFRWFVLGHI